MTATRLNLITPEDWYRLPLAEEAALKRAVTSLVDRQFRGIDNQPLLRREAADALLEQARRARAGGGVDLYLTFERTAGIPVAASLVVSLVPQPPDTPTLRAVARDLDDPAAPATVVELPSGPAVRRQRVTTVDAAELGASPDSPALLVDYTLLGPSHTLLLLSFSSPLVQVADALAELFEAVAGTVEWVP